MSDQLKEDHLNQRDMLLRDTFTPAENVLAGSLWLTSFVCFWVANPISAWTMGYFVFLGIFILVILKLHLDFHPFFLDRLWLRCGIIGLPMGLLFIQYLTGSIQNVFSKIQIDEEHLIILNKTISWLPANAAPAENKVTVIAFASMYLFAALAFLIPKSRVFFETLLAWLCFNASLLAIFGYIQKAFRPEHPIFTSGTGYLDFFAFFPYDGHWAAFATIWCAVCIAIAIQTIRNRPNNKFTETYATWYLTGAMLLGLSGFIIESYWPSIILLGTFSILLLIYAYSYAKMKHLENKTFTIFATLCFTALTCFGACQKYAKGDPHAEESQILKEITLEMFADQPIFGWGFNSFEKMLPYFANDLQLNQRHQRASSDCLQLLAEIGIFGVILLSITFGTFLYRYLKRRKTIYMTKHILIGCAAVLILAFVDTPFMSPAVFFSFCLAFFSAMRWADLSFAQVDEVDTRLRLITPEKLRGVPSFTGKHQPELK